MLQTTTWKWTGLVIALGLLSVAAMASVTFGVMNTGWKDVLHAVTAFDGSNEQLIIRDVRVPRALIAAAVGACLGMSGSLLQALTKNPLADVGIMGINNGASLLVVASVTFLGVSSLYDYIWFAFAGAGISAILVYALGSVGRSGLTPIKITLSGAAIAALLSSFTHTMLLVNERTVQEVLFWLSGSVQGRKLGLLQQVLPFMAVGWVGALFLSGPLNILMMGEDVAKGLGQRTAAVKLLTGVIVVVLAGSSVAIAGPILFVGLVTPHIARYLVGIDLRWSIPYSALLGSILLIAADIGARFVAMPNEIPIGVMTAIVGSPFFVYVARKGAAKA